MRAETIEDTTERKEERFGARRWIFLVSGTSSKTNYRARDVGEDTVLLPWYKIQDHLQELDLDLLYLLDCCFAAQSGRSELDRLGRCELLAAAPMGMVTPEPGPKSFTVALTKEIVKSYEESGFTVIKDVHARLVSRQASLHATPVHVPLRPGKRSIRLERLLVGPSQNVTERPQGAIIPALIHTRDIPGTRGEHLLTRWLGEDKPSIVESVEIIQDFVQAMEKRETPLAKAVTNAAFSKIITAKEDIKGVVEELVLLEKHADSSTQQLLGQLSTMTQEFTEKLGRSLISVKNVEEQELITNAIADPASKRVGITDALRLRQIVFSVDIVKTDIVEDECRMSSQPSLQEVKQYDAYFNKQEVDELRARIRHLAILLSAPKDRDFQSLRCFRCEQRVFERRYILHFEIPSVYLPPADEKLTLTWLIDTLKRRSRPTMNDRFKMAYALANAVHKWHSAGWLHQGIGSPNIQFLRLKEGRQIDFAQPFLFGFDFARPDSDPSLGRATDDPAFDVYRHPARQGPARKGHRKIHDYYALGVVLLEIGLWQNAAKIVTRTGEGLRPQAVQHLLKQDSSERLAHYAGVLYKEAVDRCLSSHFDIETDDEGESQLLGRFHDEVVTKIGAGISVR